MLTKRQKEILDFINKIQKSKGYAPSLQEIASHFKLSSVATVHEHVEKLKQKGYLDKEDNKARAMIATLNEERWLRIYLMGIISAGGPIEAIRNPKLIEVPKNMISRGAKYYALKVSGTSMIEEGISDGDIVVVRDQQTVDDGEKAVAYMPDENTVTLKKIYREGKRIKLVPANKYMKPFYKTNVQIQGKVVGVLRNE